MPPFLHAIADAAMLPLLCAILPLMLTCCRCRDACDAPVDVDATRRDAMPITRRHTPLTPLPLFTPPLLHDRRCFFFDYLRIFTPCHYADLPRRRRRYALCCAPFLPPLAIMMPLPLIRRYAIDSFSF
jgi:hypothetical protein